LPPTSTTCTPSSTATIRRWRCSAVPATSPGRGRRSSARSAEQREDGYSFWPVIERESGALIGEAGLFPLTPGGGEISLGYAFGPRHWGRGYATEAARAVLAEAFGPLGLQRVVAITRDANAGSRNVLRKLGFRAEGSRHVWGAEQLFFVLERDAYEAG
jgi:RimJ/RimL family protein N-acetyltransferase